MAGTNWWTTFVSQMAALPTETYPPVKDLLRGLTRVAQVQVGTYTGTGSNIDVSCDGDPKLVVLIDVTQQCMAVQIDGMADASVFLIDNGGTSYAAANGITLGTGTFRIGTDAAINTNLDSGFWLVVV